MADQKAGTAATLAIIGAIGSLFLILTGNPIWGLFLAFLAIFLGIIGMIISTSPKIGGGLVSLLSVILGVIDLGLSVLGIVGVIIF